MFNTHSIEYRKLRSSVQQQQQMFMLGFSAW